MTDRFRALILTLPLFFASSASAATLPPGTPVEGGIIADVLPSGLQIITDTIGGQVPPTFPMGNLTGGACCIDLGPLGCAAMLFYDVTNLSADVSIQSITMTPETGQVRADVVLDVVVNDAANPFTFNTSGGCSFATGDCAAMWIGPVSIDISLEIKASVTDPDGPGGTPPIVDITVPVPVHNLDNAITANDVHSNGCQADLLLSLADFLGFSIADLLLGDVVDYVENDLPASVEAAVEAGFQAAILQDVLDVMGKQVAYHVYPDGVPITAEAMRITMGGEFNALTVDRCVAGWPSDGFTSTPSLTPSVAQQRPSGGSYDAGVIVDDDFVNSALHAFWLSGLLCQSVDSDLTGISLSSDFLGAALGTEVQAEFEYVFFDEGPQPLVVRTVPTIPPEVSYGGPYDLTVHLDGLGLSFHSVILGRMAHLFTVAIDAAIGVDIGFTPYGEIAITPFIDTSNLNPRIVLNEMMPDVDEAIVSNIGPFLDGLVNDFAADLLVTQYIGPFVLFDLAIIDGEAGAVGQGDYLELFALLGTPIPGNSGGSSCAAAAGCADPATCLNTQNCALELSGKPSRIPGMAWFLIPLVALWRSRRARE